MALTPATRGILALWHIPGLGPRRIRKLWNSFGSVDAIFNTKIRDLAALLEMPPDSVSSIPSALESKSFKEELQLIESLKIDVIDFTSNRYPVVLNEIYNAPPILYTKGSKALDDGFYLAFVGSRKASFSGLNMCKKLIKRITELYPDTIIVSGLALGVDSAAHQAALESGLKTVAVVANGLSHVYPPKNRGLSKQIETSGLLVSEFPIISKPVAMNFPLRNRIISGLSKGTVVIEAGERSGALITAGYALEQNRELFALPGPADSQFHKGTNRLIQKGQAKLVIDAEDILEEFFQLKTASENLHLTTETVRIPEIVSDEEAALLDLIQTGYANKDSLLLKSGLSIQKLSTLLTQLEVKGLIISKPGARYEFIR